MSDADIKKLTAKFDVAKMEQTVEKAGTVEEAAKALNKLYPELNTKELVKHCKLMEEQYTSAASAKKGGKSKKAMELTEGELEHVAAGAGALAGGLYGGLSD